MPHDHIPEIRDPLRDACRASEEVHEFCAILMRDYRTEVFVTRLRPRRRERRRLLGDATDRLRGNLQRLLRWAKSTGRA